MVINGGIREFNDRYLQNIQYFGEKIINSFLEEMDINQDIGFFDEKNNHEMITQ